MLSLRFVRENPEVVRKDLEKRQDLAKQKWLDEVLEMDKKWRELKQDSENLRSKRNTLSDQVGKLKKEGKDASHILAEVKEIPQQILKIEEEQNKLKGDIDYRLMRMPNILHESVPFGKSEEENVVIKEWGKPAKHKFEAKSHVDIMEALGLCDTDRAGKISGSRFYFLKNDLVRLDVALQMFALDILTKKGYTLIMPPNMMRKKVYQGVTDLTDFENVMYRIESRDEESMKEEDTLYLIATSEHPMAAMHSDEIFEDRQLPIKYAGISPCYRREAGSHGKDSKGIFRVHQFNKIEQFIYCKEEDGWKLFDELLANVEEIYQKLGLPYRIVNICTGDIGTVAAKKNDLEVWMPVQQKYRELVSCSNCTAYQSTRLNIRYRVTDGNKNVHTLNSTAIATTRTMVAIMENFQNSDGSITIPKALVPYMNGQTKIELRKN